LHVGLCVCKLGIVQHSEVCWCVRACVRVSICVRIRICMHRSRPRSATAARRTPTVARNSDRLPHPEMVFACTSPCASSAAATAECPFQAATWSGVHLRPNAIAKRRQREPSVCTVPRSIYLSARTDVYLYTQPPIRSYLNSGFVSYRMLGGRTDACATMAGMNPGCIFVRFCLDVSTEETMWMYIIPRTRELREHRHRAYFL
jgi:hypothetical protein